MIYLLHDNDKVVKLLDDHNNSIAFQFGYSLCDTFMEVCANFKEQLIIWCHIDLEDNLNKSKLRSIFHHNRIMASYNLANQYYLPEQIGFVEQSFFLKVKKDTLFPTWLMCSDVGGIHASVVNLLSKQISSSNGFDYFINSIAKLSIQEGLFCYSAPELLKDRTIKKYSIQQASTGTLFKFTKQHYKWPWVFYLAFCYLIFEKRFILLPLIQSFFYRKHSKDFDLETIEVSSSKRIVNKKTIDVIIPTIGRKQYLFDVLKDLSKQTHLPKNVIIVEQNPRKSSTSELNYLKNENWPFKIKHIFTHQTGVCNARNVALSNVESEWTLLGDDDNRFEPNLIEQLFKAVEKFGVKVGSTVYLQPNEVQTYLKTAQTSIFGAGNSIVKTELIDHVQFDKRFEFNYGEDTDFGMQLRYLGEDVVFFSDIKITHLKAPIGGYRRKVKHPWENEHIVPKPSPTIYLLKSTYQTTKQLLGYKLLLGLRTYNKEKPLNPIPFIKRFNKQWEVSGLWSKKLNAAGNA